MSHLPTTLPTVCPDVPTLRRYAGGTLPEAAAREVGGHVATCPECGVTLDRLRAGHLDPTATYTGDQTGSETDPLPPPGGFPPPDDETAPTLPGYQPVGRTGAGGMGVVWRVRDLRFGRPLAVKVLRARKADQPRWVARFEEEARITGRLTHPYIVPVHTMGRLADGRPYYTMKLVEGETLAARTAGAGGPDHHRMRAVQVFGQVCQAVGFAHSQGVIHRDLKPANVMVGTHGEVQVMDWGLAKVLTDPQPAAEPDGPGDSDNTSDDYTRPGSVMGTAAYMPPEQARGLVGQVDRRSDVFGLGAILCEVLTGDPPYVGPNRDVVRALAAEARLDGARARLRASGADPELIRLAERCLAPEKADRPADGGVVAAAVAAYVAGVQERAEQERLERERRRVWAAARRRRRLWVALAAVLAAAVTGAVFAVPYAKEQYKQRQLREWAAWAAAYHPSYEVTTSYRMADGKCQVAFNRTATNPNDPDPNQVITAAFHRAEQDGLLDRITAVEFTGLGLTRVPPEVFTLPKLSALHLGGNHLTEVPADIGRLSDLTTLGLGQNLLEALPPEIERLDKLTALDLSDNNFKTFPREVFRIPTLTSLSLKRNERIPEADLPAEVGHLINLTYLDLARTNLRRLPPQIGQLVKLTKLHLPRNNLTELPPEIGQLRNLVAVHLSNNKLTRLPPQIGMLTNLAELYASDCGLTGLPPEIGQLRNLTTAHLSGNQLLTVPPEVADLHKLRALDLRNNVRDGVMLRELPPAVAAALRPRKTAVQLGEMSSPASGAGTGGGGGKGTGGGKGGGK